MKIFMRVHFLTRTILVVKHDLISVHVFLSRTRLAQKHGSKSHTNTRTRAHIHVKAYRTYRHKIYRKTSFLVNYVNLHEAPHMNINKNAQIYILKHKYAQKGISCLLTYWLPYATETRLVVKLGLCYERSHVQDPTMSFVQKKQKEWKTKLLITILTIKNFSIRSRSAMKKDSN